MAPNEPLAPAGPDIHEDAPLARPSMASIELTEDMGASTHKMADPGPTRKTGLLARRTLGLACLLLTVCLWTTSNFLASVSCAKPTAATTPPPAAANGRPSTFSPTIAMTSLSSSSTSIPRYLLFP